MSVPARPHEPVGAALRALTGDPSLHCRGSRLWQGMQPLPAFGPHLRLPPEGTHDLRHLRAAADGCALRLLHSRAALHRSLAPVEPRERWVFELLEQLRVESLVPPTLAGVAANLSQRFAQWSQDFLASGLAGTETGLLLYAVVHVCRSRVTAQPVPEAADGVIESTRAAIAPLLGTSLAGLRRARFDQAAYASHAGEVARLVAHALPAQEDRAAGAARRAGGFSLWFEFDAGEAGPTATAGIGGAPVPEQGGGRYRAFTTAYDRERDAGTLVRARLLDEYRAKLDAAAHAFAANVPRLARELRAVLQAPAREGWEDGHEEGVLDGRRLAQLVASPTQRHLFRQDLVVPRADCAVAFLLDCSASMREFVEPVALFVDTCAHAFDGASVSCEVLGFTTGSWNGGRAWRDWQHAGRPPLPGRLNERLHLVFKDAATPPARGRRGIATLFKADLFREGVDGEAVEWACARLLAADARRRLLFVVSDGSPMDSATALANDPRYLEEHLRDVLARHEADGRIEVTGIGVGQDLGPWYRRTLPLDLAGGIDRGSFRALVQLLRRPLR